ncbi:MAG: hypothetical protein HWE14_01140 [Flavobacteriia bacterium]|nr:hypothetical protein [Flavobacteriia bacterium]
MRLLSFALAILCSCAAIAQEKVLLRLNLNPGDEHIAVIEKNTRREQSMMGSEQGSEQEEMVRIRYTCTDTIGGISKMKMDVERVTLESDGLAGEQSYDSDDPDEESFFFAMPAADMVEIDFTLSLEDNAKVVEMTGTDELASSIIAHLGAFNSDDSEIALENLEESLTSESFLREYSPCLIEFPEEEVGVGDSWTEFVSATALNSFTVEETYTVKEITETEVVLQVRGKIRTLEDAEPSEMGWMKMKQNLRGSKAGTIRIDRAKGLVLSADFEQSLTGELELLPNDYFPEGQTFPMNQFDSMKVTTE